MTYLTLQTTRLKITQQLLLVVQVYDCSNKSFSVLCSYVIGCTVIYLSFPVLCSYHKVLTHQHMHLYGLLLPRYNCIPSVSSQEVVRANGTTECVVLHSNLELQDRGLQLHFRIPSGVETVLLNSCITPHPVDYRIRAVRGVT